MKKSILFVLCMTLFLMLFSGCNAVYTGSTTTSDTTQGSISLKCKLTAKKCVKT